MDNQPLGEELNQLARYLFDSAAGNWYTSVGLEVAAGVLAVVLSVVGLSGDWALLGAAVGTVLLVISYALRLRFDTQYDAAETMRRQSVLTEVLDWPVGKVQMSEWRRHAGKKIRSRARLAPRDPHYYSTQAGFGPERLAEMTIESAFCTRHSYAKLGNWIWIIFVSSLVMLALVVVIALTDAVPSSIDHLIARIVFSIIPILLAVDLLGWGLRLRRLQSAMRLVEEGLERLIGTTDMTLPQVLRLVSEYNCQVTAGIPIHQRLYARWCDEISELWSQR